MRETWQAVDAYLTESVVRPRDGFDALRQAADDAGLPPIEVSAAQGKLLHLFARMVGARRILEIGTLAGYSAAWLALALPADGVLVTLELDPRHAEVARDNLERMGVASLVDVRVGAAVEALAQLVADGVDAFDLVFIDADKQSNAEYFAWALKLSRRGTVIVVDNVVRKGAVADAASEDPAVQGVRRLNQAMAAEPRVAVTAMQTVGAKGYDGFALALVVA